ncbi:MAG: hypothetical protein ABSA18_01390 [Dehalococcoidia bacterium]|jgi:hypothetical protein
MKSATILKAEGGTHKPLVTSSNLVAATFSKAVLTVTTKKTVVLS